MRKKYSDESNKMLDNILTIKEKVLKLDMDITTNKYPAFYRPALPLNRCRLIQILPFAFATFRI